jgi:WD40 repeat protein
MFHTRARILALIFSVLLLVLLTACGGDKKAASVGPPATVTLNPQPSVSLNAGDVLQMSVSVLDSQGRSVFNQTVNFASSDPRVQIASNGSLCGGTWKDATGQPSLTSPVICTPAAADAAGIQSNITATAGSITSNVVTASIHIQITSLEVVADPSPAPACVTQAGTVNYKAIAKGMVNGTLTDITASIGNINWQVGNGLVASAAPLTTLGKTGGSDPTTVTAKLPGKTPVIAIANTITTVNSLPATFVECPIAQITITPPATSTPPITLSGTGQTVQMTPTVVDTTGATLATLPTLTWASNPVAAATVSTAGLVTGQLAGTAGIVVGCIPANNCNIGLEPVYSNLVPVTISGTSSTTVYASSPTTLVPITTGTNAVGTAITFPNSQQANSLLFSPTGARAFLGSSAGMMVVDATTNTFVTTVTGAPGKVLAVSPDGNLVIVSDTSAGFLRLFNGSANTITNFIAPDATAADFNPDGSKAYIVAGAKLFILQSGAPLSMTLTPAVPTPSGAQTQLVKFQAEGNVAYIANTNTPRVLTCNNTIVAGPSASPLIIAALPNAKQMLGAEGGFIDAFDVTVTAATSGTSACPSVVSEALTKHAASGPDAPVQLIVTPDSTKAFITSETRVGSLQAYDVGANAAAGTPSTIALTGGTAGTTTGGVTLDSKTLYVGGTDNTVHVIDVATGTDSATPISLTFKPDFVAVRPH